MLHFSEGPSLFQMQILVCCSERLNVYQLTSMFCCSYECITQHLKLESSLAAFLSLSLFFINSCILWCAGLEGELCANFLFSKQNCIPLALHFNNNPAGAWYNLPSLIYCIVMCTPELFKCHIYSATCSEIALRLLWIKHTIWAVGSRPCQHSLLPGKISFLHQRDRL